MITVSCNTEQTNSKKKCFFFCLTCLFSWENFLLTCLDSKKKTRNEMECFIFNDGDSVRWLYGLVSI
jgi:uncharacterized Zn ribbon protein